MVTWSHCDDLVTVTTVPPGCGDCDKCAGVAGNSGFWEEEVGGVTRDREIDNKASRENFLFFNLRHIYTL